MSILSSLLRKKITWSQAASQAVAWAGAVISHDETLTTAASETLTIVKQGASDAISLADTAIGAHAADIADAVEAALEAALAAATGGKTAVLNPLIDAGIDQLAKVAADAAHAKALEWKAKLAAPVVPIAPVAVAQAA